MEVISNPGWIEVVTGPMFAGKSEELIRRIRRLEYAKKKIKVYKPAIDNRYTYGKVESHLNNKADATVVASSVDIPDLTSNDVDAVIIDEVQFFDNGIIEKVDKMANSGVRVIVGGLDTDFRGEPFPIVATLLAKAEFVTKLTAICVVCGAPATMTQRIINGVPASINDPTVLVGEKQTYEPRCRHCHIVKK